jgi:hypothetical protein
MYSAFKRATAMAILAGGLLVPASALAAPSSPTGTGTVVGAVTCGPAEDAPAAHIVVSAVGADLQTLTDGTGKFTLVGLPAQQTFTIDAIADPQGSLVTSRFNVSVQPGETLDIGSMDLGICGQPAPPAPVQDDQPADWAQQG